MQIPTAPGAASSRRSLLDRLRPWSAVILFGLLTPSGIDAHDYWLASGDGPDGVSTITLSMGGDFSRPEKREMDPARLVSFRLVLLSREIDLKARLGTERVPSLTLEAADLGGVGVVAMERTPAEITLAAKAFQEYLHHEGLNTIAKERERLGESSRPGRERYTRYLKLLVGPPGPDGKILAERPVGHRLEILFDLDPRELHDDARLPILVRFEDAPLADAQVSIVWRGTRGRLQRRDARTNHAGEASLPVKGSGLHSVRLVHMRRCASNPIDHAVCDWESFWTSYTFQRSEVSPP
jgi:hypothetical protein